MNETERAVSSVLLRAGVSSIDVKASLAALTAQWCRVATPTAQARWPVLDWLKQDQAPRLSALAQAVGQQRKTVPTWWSHDRDGGVSALWAVKQPPGGLRVMPQWAATALAQR